MEPSVDPRYLLRVLWFRKWYFLVPATLAGALAVSLLFLLPPIYRSEATIFVEGQDIPEDLVPSLVTGYVDQRIDMLTRQVMLKGELADLIDRYDLYPESRQTAPVRDLAERLRDDITLERVRSEINDPRAGGGGEVTVAFKIAFDYPDPQVARRVVDELVSLYLATNQQTRRRVAEETTNFFSAERAEIENRIARIEDEIAAFQSENRELLPEEAVFKRELLASTEEQLRDLRATLRSLREREGFLETQLALTDEFTLADERFATSPSSELELKRAELATARARYSSNHPDVVRLAREVRSLEGVVGASGEGASTELVEREAALAAELASLTERYTPQHPDVQGVERQLANVRAALAEAGGAPAPSGRVRNDTHVQLSAQLNSVQAEIRSVEEQRGELEAERRELREQLVRAPAVEREYTRLNRELDNAVAKRDELSDKETTAALSGSLEARAIGEQLTLAEPATLPDDPVSPNKKLILALGMVLAVGSGGASVFIAELFDRTVRSTTQLARILGDTPIAMIPSLVSPRQRRRTRALRGGALVVVLAAGAGGLYWVDRTVVPLTVLGDRAGTVVEGWLK
jgi:uncharacterized protein involved in exopolysaccharide biosynthesis